MLDQELKTNGFAGPTKIARLVFLAFYTRTFNRPVSLVLKGPSGSGKSYVLKSALKYIPPTCYEMFSGMSEKALIYSELDLKHRYLIIQEAAGLANGDGRALLRQLLTEGYIRYQSVSSGDKGLKPIELRIDGPIGLIMTTTDNWLHKEDESRVLSIQLDQSTEQLEAMIMAKAMDQKPTDSQHGLEHWHRLHDYVCDGGFRVHIPYKAELAKFLPRSHHRVVRDFEHLLSLIDAHTRLHFRSRARNSKEELISTIADYAAVYDLVAEPFSQGIETAVPPHIRELVQAVDDLTRERPSGVSQRCVADHLRRDPATVSRNVDAAIASGYLINETPGQGRQAKLVLGDLELPSRNALPTPNQLEQAIARESTPEHGWPPVPVSNGGTRTRSVALPF